jgi:hypothetical protein
MEFSTRAGGGISGQALITMQPVATSAQATSDATMAIRRTAPPEKEDDIGFTS